MVDYVPATAQQQSIFTMMQNGTAYNFASLFSAQNVGVQMTTLAGSMANVPSLSNASASLATFASNPMSALSSHLTDQFANLPQNLQLGTSQISNALGMGTGNPSAACQSAGIGGMASMFGSIMGMAQKLMNSAQGHTAAAGGLVAAQVGAAVIHQVVTQPVSATAAQQVSTAIGPFADLTALEAAMMNPTPANLQAIAQAITALSTLPASSLGIVAGVNGTSNLATLGSSISALSSPVTTAPTSASGSGSSPITPSSVMSAISGLNSAISQFAPGGLSGIMNSLGAGSLAGAAQSMVSGIMGKMGSLGGIMNNVTNMIGGEKAALGAATKALTSAAAAYNLPILKNNACASAVLSAAGSPALNDALGGNPASPAAPAGDNTAPETTPKPDGTGAQIPDAPSGSLSDAGIYSPAPTIGTGSVPAFGSGVPTDQIQTTPLNADGTPYQTPAQTAIPGAEGPPPIPSSGFIQRRPYQAP